MEEVELGGRSPGPVLKDPQTSKDPSGKDSDDDEKDEKIPQGVSPSKKGVSFFPWRLIPGISRKVSESTVKDAVAEVAKSAAAASDAALAAQTSVKLAVERAVKQAAAAKDDDEEDNSPDDATGNQDGSPPNGSLPEPIAVLKRISSGLISEDSRACLVLKRIREGSLKIKSKFISEERSTAVRETISRLCYTPHRVQMLRDGMVLLCLVTFLRVLEVPMRSFILGASSAMLGASVAHPVDLVKVRLQVQKSKLGLVAMCSQIYTEAGIPGFFRGVSATLLRQFMYTGTRFAVYEGTKGFMPSLLGAVVAGLVGAIVGSPAEVALVRLQAGAATPGAGLKVTIKQIIQTEGVRGLYKGIEPLCCRAVMVTIGQMACFDFLKPILVSVGLVEGPLLHLLASILAGLCSAALSNPVDVVKTRLQAGGGRYRGAVDCVRSIVHDEGIWVLNSGILATCIRMVPYVTVMLFTNEYLKKVF